MRPTTTHGAENSRRVREELLRALVELVALLPTRFTPNTPKCQVIVHDNLQLLRLVSLVQDRLDHSAATFQVIFLISRDKYVEWLVFIDCCALEFVWVENS